MGGNSRCEQGFSTLALRGLAGAGGSFRGPPSGGARDCQLPQGQTRAIRPEPNPSPALRMIRSRGSTEPNWSRAVSASAATPTTSTPASPSSERGPAEMTQGSSGSAPAGACARARRLTEREGERGSAPLRCATFDRALPDRRPGGAAVAADSRATRRADELIVRRGSTVRVRSSPWLTPPLARATSLLE
jgi:hypothetical protein